MFKLLWLAAKRSRSPVDYRAMQMYIARRVVRELEERGVQIANNRILDLGCWPGGFTLIFHRVARSLIAADLRWDDELKRRGIPFVQLDVRKGLPFKDGAFDLVYCSSLIEHVPKPGHLLRELHRIVRADGRLYLSFPPFYSLFLIGGHQFKPFHLLGERACLRVYNWLHRSRITSYRHCYAEWGGLYPLKVDHVANHIRRAGFVISETYTRLSKINTTKLPGIFKDLFTWHVCFLANKPSHTGEQPF